MRICSLLPGATEILFALGLEDQIVGVTHECDYPADARQKHVVVRSRIDSKRLSGGEIDRQVQEALAGGNSLYAIDETAFIEAAPDLILTQGLCEVCALDYNAVVRAAKALPRSPVILSLNPQNLADVLADIRKIGAATSRENAAAELVRDLESRIQAVAYRSAIPRPRVVCLEWFDPLYVAGHWVPEVVELAGGEDVLGRSGQPSTKIDWRRVVEAKPEIILLMPCGFDVRRTVREATPLRLLDGWNDLPAVKTGNVFALNGNAYFSRPGPRLVNGLEILAQVLHPAESASETSPSDAKRVIH